MTNCEIFQKWILFLSIYTIVIVGGGEGAWVGGGGRFHSNLTTYIR